LAFFKNLKILDLKQLKEGFQFQIFEINFDPVLSEKNHSREIKDFLEKNPAQLSFKVKS